MLERASRRDKKLASRLLCGRGASAGVFGVPADVCMSLGGLCGAGLEEPRLFVVWSLVSCLCAVQNLVKFVWNLIISFLFGSSAGVSVEPVSGASLAASLRTSEAMYNVAPPHSVVR